MIPVSAKKHQNLDTLLETVLLQADILDLKASPTRRASGVVLEAKLDKGRGAVATALVQQGTLRVGDPFIAGRVVSAVAAGGCAVLAARLAAELTENRLAGLFAGLLIATTPLSIAWDVRVRPESLFLLFVVATIIACRRSNATPTPRNWSIALACSGLAFFTKYEAIALFPLLAWTMFRGGAHRRVFVNWRTWIALIPWLAGFAWMLTHRGVRIGDYRELLTAQGLVQIPVWSWWTIVNALDVYLWPVAILSGLGAWAWWRSRRERTTATFVLWIAGCFVVMIAAGYNWSSRYLLLLLPAVVLPAARGLMFIRMSALRVAVILAVTASNLWVAQMWVRAEKDRWMETRQMADAVVRHVPAGAKIWSDDPYLTPYLAKRDVVPMANDARVSPGDYVVLHDLYGALRRGRTVQVSMEELGGDRRPEILAWTSVTHTPLSGEVVDPTALAQAGSLRNLGPRSYWGRRQPITVDAVLVRLPSE